MLTPQQQEFFNRYIKKTGLGFKKKKNEERRLAYEAYLQLKANVSEAIAALPESVESTALRLTGLVNGVDSMVKDAESLGNAFADLKLIEGQVKEALIEADRLASKESPEGQIRLMVAKAVNDTVSVAEEDRVGYHDLAEDLREAMPDNPSAELPEARAYENGLNTTINALRRVVGEAADDVDTARDMVDAIMRGWASERQSLIDARDRLKTDDDALEGSIASAVAREALFAHLEEANESIDVLEDWASPDAGTHRAEHDRLTKLLSKTDADFTALEVEGAALVTAAERDKAKHKTAYDQAAAPLLQRLKALGEGGRALDKKKLKKEQIEQLSALFGQCREAMQTGCNIAVLQPLDAFLTDGERLLHDLQNAEVTNTALEKNLKEIEGLLKKELGSKCIRQSDRAMHMEGLTKLKTEWVTLSPMEAQQQVMDLKLRVRASITQENEQQEWRKGIKVEIKAERAQLKLLNSAFRNYLASKGEKKADYEGKLKAEIDLCETWSTTKENRSFESTTESKLANASTEIAAMLAKFEDTTANASDLDGLVSDHNAVIAAKVDAEVDRKRLITELSNFQHFMKMVVKEYPAIKTRMDELDLVKNLLKQAKDQSKKGGDVANGRRLLKSAGDQLMDLAKRPAKLDHKSLGEIGEKWSTSYAAFEEKIKLLTDKVTTGAGSDEETARAQKLLTQLNAVKGQMKADAFNKVAEKLKQEDLPEGARKAAREEALSKVRAYGDVIRGDDLIKLCVLNPFDVKSFASTAHKVLREIELEVLRGV